MTPVFLPLNTENMFNLEEVMRQFKYIILTAAIIATPAAASDKSKLEAKGLVKLTRAEIAEVKMGKTIKGTHVPSGTKWSASYKKDGTKLVKFNGKTKKFKWTYQSGKWCETIQKKMNCSEATFKLKNKCYVFKGNSIEHTFRCK